MALLELSCLFFFSFLSQSVFFSPSLPTYGVRYSKCGVSIIWTLLRDHAPSVRRAARITHWHWQFSCNTDIFFSSSIIILFLFFPSTCHQYLGFLQLLVLWWHVIYHLRYSLRSERVCISIHIYLATFKTWKFYVISNNFLDQDKNFSEKFIFRRIKFPRVSWNFYHFFFFFFFVFLSRNHVNINLNWKFRG